MTIKTQVSLPVLNLLLSHRQDFPNNHLLNSPTTENQQRNMEMRDEVISSVGTHEVDTSGCQVSELEDIEYNWWDLDLNTVSFSTKHRHSIFRFSVQWYPDGFSGWKFGSDRPWGRPRELSFSNLGLWETNLIPCVDVKSDLGKGMGNIPSFVYRHLYDFFFLSVWFSKNV